MELIKVYDACCDGCGNWFNAKFTPLNNATKKQSELYMKQYGWGVKDGKTMCEECMK